MTLEQFIKLAREYGLEVHTPFSQEINSPAEYKREKEMQKIIEWHKRHGISVIPLRFVGTDSMLLI